MKKMMLSFLGACSFALLGAQTTIGFWDFNSIVNDANTATGIMTPASGAGTINPLGGITTSFDTGNNNDPNTTDNAAINSQDYPAQSTNPKTAGIQVNVNTTGLNNIQFEFYQRLSNTANNTWVVQYTLDNSVGSPVWVDFQTFTFTPAPTGTGDTWYQRQLNFSSVTGLNNNPNVGFRVVSDYDPVMGTYLSAKSTSLYATTGKVRFDLVKVSAAPVALPPGTVQFAALHQSVTEAAGTAAVTLNITSPNANPCRVVLTTSVHTTATAGADYVITNDTVTFPGGSSTPQTLTVNITNDAIVENAEYVSFKMTNLVNGVVGANAYHILYIRDNDYTPPTPTNEVVFQLLGSFSNGAEGTNSAEIVSYDSSTQQLVIANSIGKKIDFVDFSNPSAPLLINTVNISALGNINSVVTRNGIVAVALENSAPQSNGKVLFYNSAGALISQVDVGAMPDMITFDHSGNKVLVACEGEPNDAYTIDPEGTIAIIDISGGIAAVTNANVNLLNFNSYDPQIATLRAAGVRVYGPGATVSKDFEPEYITISDDDQTAWVTLQENNALAVVDINTNTITQIIPLGTIDHAMIANGMDASDQSSGINIANYPVKGMYLPDAISHIEIGGDTYLFTANEGDSRAWSGMNEESRISGLSLDPTAFPDQNILKSNFMLGRLNATNKTGDTDNDGDIDVIHVYGGRGFSIWDETGNLVYNSGNLLENIIAAHPVFAPMFNASNTSGGIAAKNRSDDKGPEIEGLSIGTIGTDHFVFVSAERLGGVFVFNINTPATPVYVGYYNNRLLATNGPDRGAEGIIHIPASASPNGNDLLILANEVSSTLTIYQVNTCADLSTSPVTYSANDSICAGNSTDIQATLPANTTVQWLNNGTIIPGETNADYTVNASGQYSIAVTNTDLACSDTSEIYPVYVENLPTLSFTVADTVLCAGDSTTLDATSSGTIIWNNSVTDNTAFVPASTGIYVVTSSSPMNCTTEDSVLITVHALPVVSFTLSVDSVCASYGPVNLTGATPAGGTFSGTGVTGSDFNPATGTGSYTITYTYSDVNGCENADTENLLVSGCLSFEETGDLNVNIYPNPAEEFVNIQLMKEGSYQLIITDLQGKTIMSRTINATSMIDISTLGTGIYVIRIENGAETFHSKLIKK